MRRTMKTMRIRVALGVDCGWFLAAEMIFNVFGVNIFSQRPTAAQLIPYKPLQFIVY